MMLLSTTTTPRFPPTERSAIGIDHHRQAQHKRKAESPPENNERLSKRLSLLNLERNGSKLYVPVENSAVQPSSTLASTPPSIPPAPRPSAENDSMQLDDSKHKVYIYDLEAEISDAESEEGKLLFLPDVADHLRANRIPPHILSSPSSDSAGRELVLYNEPSALSIPQEHDSVRKAVIEARARIREKQRVASEESARSGPPLAIGFETSLPDLPQAPQLNPTQHDPDEMDLD